MISIHATASFYVLRAVTLLIFQGRPGRTGDPGLQGGKGDTVCMFIDKILAV